MDEKLKKLKELVEQRKDIDTEIKELMDTDVLAHLLSQKKMGRPPKANGEELPNPLA